MHPTQPLKPCPFCGSESIKLQPQPHGFSINCQECQVKKLTVTKHQEQAEAEWNMRKKLK